MCERDQKYTPSRVHLGFLLKTGAKLFRDGTANRFLHVLWPAQVGRFCKVFKKYNFSKYIVKAWHAYQRDHFSPFFKDMVSWHLWRYPHGKKEMAKEGSYGLSTSFNHSPNLHLNFAVVKILMELASLNGAKQCWQCWDKDLNVLIGFSVWYFW